MSSGMSSITPAFGERSEPFFLTHADMKPSLESYLDRINQIIQNASLATSALPHSEVDDRGLAARCLCIASSCIKKKEYKQALDAYSKACLYTNAIAPGFYETLPKNPLAVLHLSLLGRVDFLQKSSEKTPKVMNIAEEAQIPSISTSMSQEAWNSADIRGFSPYPKELVAFLAEPCSIWPGKKRSETHIVVPLFPTIKYADGFSAPRTLKSLNQLAKASGLGCRYIWEKILKPEVAEPAEKEFHWAVLTKDVLLGSRNAKYDAQKQLVEAKGYEMPGVLDAATAILWEKQYSKERLFNCDPLTFTRCKEKVQGYALVVGGFAPDGLCVNYDNLDLDYIGVAGFRKF